ncbi:hypothetical protein L1987_30805 [Smallanthus sonchifolius]|uniref:Uncharacterized protein n=1 Tax=Smallanthus sonchifolius TaxID=185202 RepID=A0ACB9I3Q9_9ASTR|nr:hypothetical protein L1987_30805 [Smallanthus sonchifolius]
MQLKKEGRRNEYEKHKLQALNQPKKMVIQRKTEKVTRNGNGTNVQSNEKSLRRWIEVEVMVNVHEVGHEYEKQGQVYAYYINQL